MDCTPTLVNLPSSWNYVLGTTMAITSATTTIENIVVLIILYKNIDLRTPSYKILRSLAFADLLTGCIVAPLHAIQYLDRHAAYNCVMEHLRRFLSAVSLGASALTIGFISYDRCVHLVSLQPDEMTKKKLYGVLGLCWAIPILLPFLRLIDKNDHAYAAVLIAFGTMILLTVIVSYIGVMGALEIHRRRQSGNTSAADTERKAGITVIIIITFQIIMILPIQIHYGLNFSKSYSDDIRTKTYNLGMVLGIINSSVNPFIYVLRNSTMKKHALELLGLNNEDNEETQKLIDLNSRN